MKKAIFLFSIIGILSSCSGDTKEKNSENSVIIEGVALPRVLYQGDTALVLNGGGVRSALFIKVYVGGLYLLDKTHNGEEIVNADKPSIIRMAIISHAFTSKMMSRAVRNKCEESAEGNIAPFQSRLNLLCGILDTVTVNKGDVLDLWYTPNEGISFYRNGKDQNILVKGLDFKQLLFKNWLSETHPAGESLRKGMLGLE